MGGKGLGLGTQTAQRQVNKADDDHRFSGCGGGEKTGKTGKGSGRDRLCLIILVFVVVVVCLFVCLLAPPPSPTASRHVKDEGTCCRASL